MPRQRCKVCRRYIGEPRGPDPLFADYCTPECAAVEGVQPLPQRCRGHRHKVIYDDGGAADVVRRHGGSVYRCPLHSGHWHHTSAAKEA